MHQSKIMCEQSFMSFRNTSNYWGCRMLRNSNHASPISHSGSRIMRNFQLLNNDFFLNHTSRRLHDLQKINSFLKTGKAD